MRNCRTFNYMKDSTFTVQGQAIIIRRYKDIGITSKLQAFDIPTAQLLPARFYNGRIAYQYKNIRVGLTTLRRQPRCHLVLTIEQPVLPF